MLNEYEQRLNDLMVDIYDSVQKVEQNMLKNVKLELSISEMNVIEVIGRNKEGCSVSDIAHELKLTKPSITAAIKRLEAKGFIGRVRSDIDARVWRIVLTRNGKRADAVHRYFHEKAVRATVKDVPAEHRESLLLAMSNLSRFLKNSM